MAYRFTSKLRGGLMWFVEIDEPPLAMAMQRDSLRVALAWGNCRLAESLPGERGETPDGGYEWYDDMASAMAGAAVFVREAIRTVAPDELPELTRLLGQLEEAAALGRAAMQGG